MSSSYTISILGCRKRGKGRGEIERHLGPGFTEASKAVVTAPSTISWPNLSHFFISVLFGVRAAPADEFHQRVSGFSVIGPVKNRVATLSWPVFSIMIHVIS